MIYAIADSHFSHNNIIKYCNRPFKNVGEMNTVMMCKWNEVVGEEDLVYVIGDFTLDRNWSNIKYCSWI